MREIDSVAELTAEHIGRDKGGAWVITARTLSVVEIQQLKASGFQITRVVSGFRIYPKGAIVIGRTV